MRPRFHYDWHWVWHTGNGDLGNQGVHQLDICRHLIGQHRYPEHIFSIGGRLKWDDAGQTPNTQVVYFDYKPVPLIFEVRHLPIEPGVRGMPVFRNTRIGSILECEDGFISESAAFDNKGQRIERFDDDGGRTHLPNFIQAVRDNRPDKVVCPIEDGHLSSSLSHTALCEYRDTERPDMMLGVGSICDAPTAAMYIGVGADFVVGPILDEEVAKICNSRKIPYSPGCGSVTEIHKAHMLGVDICKVFPGEQVGGPGFVKAVKGPMPWTDIMPTGGVSPIRESLTAWFNAGIVCAGMGSNLITKELLAAKDYAGITKKVKETITLIQEIRRDQ